MQTLSGKHVAQARQACFQRCPHFWLRAEELYTHLLAIQIKPDLDRPEIRRGKADVRTTDTLASQPGKTGPDGFSKFALLL